MKEQIAIKISRILKDICPSFSRCDGRTGPEWQHCKCKATDGVCICVWYITDKCKVGTWEKLSFVKEYNNNNNNKTKQDKALMKAKSALNSSNNDEKSVEDRFEILDL